MSSYGRRRKCGIHGITNPGSSDPTPRLAREALGQWEPEPDEPEGWGPHRVYFLHAPDARLVKIGYSKNHVIRVKAVSQAVKGEAKLIGCLNGGLTLERLMHQKFSEYRVQGEWFNERILPEARKLIRADRDFYGTEPRTKGTSEQRKPVTALCTEQVKAA